MFFNQYWQDKTNGKYAEPYIDLAEYIASFYGKTPDFFLFILLVIELGFEKAKIVVWRQVDQGFTSITASNKKNELKTIVLPKLLQNYLKENQVTNSNAIILFNPEIQRIRNDVSSFFLADITLGSVEDFPKKQAFVEDILKYKQENFTRDCLDPWEYLEIKDNGRQAPCCSIHYWLTKDSAINERTRKELRKNLLRGYLRKECSVCNIRAKIPISKFQNKINKLANRYNVGSMEAFPLRNLRIEMTTNCNLRCTYCNVSNPTYKGKDIKQSNFDEALTILKSAPKNINVHLNGHGEATFHPNWKEYAQQIINLGYKPFLITNLAKNYTEEEINTLAQFKVIQISLDSDNEEMMLKIRKAVKPSKIFNQLERIRQSAKKQGIIPPKISFSVGIYNPSVWKMDIFMRKLIALKVDSITFWNLVEHEHNKSVTSIFSLPFDEFTKAKQIIYNGLKQLQEAGISYEIAGKFIEDICQN